jgi:hypothetical protein
MWLLLDSVCNSSAFEFPQAFNICVSSFKGDQSSVFVKASFACGLNEVASLVFFQASGVPDPWSFFILDTPSPDDRH